MAGTYNWLDPEVENQLYEELEARSAAQQLAASSASPAQAEIAAGLSDAYPWLDPGVAQSLTLAGLPANSPQAREIAEMAGRAGVEDGQFSEPADSTPDSFFDSLWDGVKTGSGLGLDILSLAGTGSLNALKGGIAVLAAPFEEIIEGAVPAFWEAEQETDPLFGPAEGTEVPIFGRWNLQNLVGSLSRPLQGEFWDEFWESYTTKAAPSTLRLAAMDLLEGRAPKLFQAPEDVRPGEDPNHIGLLGNFQRRQELRDRIQLPEGLGGHATLGRIVAREVFEPGGGEYEFWSGVVDFGANLAPVDLGLGKASRGARGALGLLSEREIIELGGRVGLLPGITKQVNTSAAIDNFLNKPVGARLIEWMTDTDDVGKIYHAIGQADPKLAHTLAQTVDPNMTREILRSSMGAGRIRGVPTAGRAGRAVGRTVGTTLETLGRPLGLGRGYGDFGALFGPGASMHRSIRNVRMLQDVPGLKLNPHDLRGAAREITNWVSNAKMGDEALNKYLSILSEIEPGDSVRLYNLSRKMGEDLVRKLVNQEGYFRRTFTENHARGLTRMFDESLDEFRLYFIDHLGRNADVLGSERVLIDGDSVQMPSVHLLSEVINDAVPLPGTPREIKKATSFFGRIWDDSQPLGQMLRRSETAADYFLHKLWKPAQLITRFAYPVRVIGEEQLRMAAAGMDSMFRHPISYLAWASGRKGSVDLTNNFFDEVQSFQSALARGSAGWNGAPSELLTGRHIRVRRDRPELYYRGAAEELQQLAADPVAKRLAGGLYPADAQSIDLLADQRLVVEVPLPRGGSRVMSRDEFRRFYDDLADRVLRNEKASDPSDWSSAERFAFENDDWQEFSRLRGYTDDEMADYELWWKLNQDVEPTRRIPYPDDSPNAGKMAQASDPDEVFEANMVVQGGFEADDIEAVKEWFWSGTGQKFRKQASEIRGKGALAHSREAADRHIDTIMDRIRIKTGENEDLLHFVRNGSLPENKVPLEWRGQKLANVLEGQYDDVLPEFVKVEELASGPGSSMLDRATSFMFNALMTQPTNKLSRSPFYRQSYYQEVERLAGFANKDTQLEALRRLADLGFGEGEVRRISQITARTVGDQIQSIDELDTLAKAFALDRTRDLLYDLSRRNQFFDAARHVFPFGDAWKEIFVAWSKILEESPSTLRRFQQGVQGAMGPGFGELGSQLLGTGTQPGQGFFYPDPLTGELIFNYPGSELISEWMFDTELAEVDFAGFVSGLNLFAATILPGVGPSVQLPTQIFTEAFNVQLPEAINDIINPFGELDLSDPSSILLPAWVDKIRTALFEDPEANRLFINTTADVMRAMVRSGQFNTNSPEAMDELVREAQARAHTLLLIRGVAQSTFPTGPSLRWDSTDLQGNLMPVKLLGDEYRKLIDDYNGDSDKALTEWLRKFGTDNLLALQGKTRPIKYRPLEEEGHEWVKNHPDIMDDYDLVGGLFAPDPREGTFDYNAWNQALDEGAREQLGPEEMIQLSNNYIARVAWEQAKKSVEGRTDAQATLWLEEVRKKLQAEYPGFQDSLVVLGRPDPDDLIEEMERAIADPRLADTDTAVATRLYLEAREQAQRVVDANQKQLHGSKTFKSSASTRFLRDWLRTVAEEIMNKYPDFGRTWDNVFRRELTEDE